MEHLNVFFISDDGVYDACVYGACVFLHLPLSLLFPPPPLAFCRAPASPVPAPTAPAATCTSATST